MTAGWVVLALSSLTLLYIISSAGGQVPLASKNIVPAVEDVPFIRCSVCRRALKHIKQQVTELRNDALSKGKKVEEDDILSTVEASCSSDTKQGDWISKYDIVEVDRGLKIEEQESSRRCHQECKTISKACEESIGDVDTDLGELLWKDELSLSKLINKVCYEMTDACTRKVPEFKKGKRNDEEFKPLSADEKKAYDIWKKMKTVPGMPGMEMYSKDDIAQMGEQLSDAKSNDKVDNEEHASGQAPISEETNLGFLETVKAAFSNLFSSVRKLFSFNGKRTEF